MTWPYQWYVCPEAFDEDYEELVRLFEELAREEAAPAIESVAA
jgi:hypothetical protein